MKNPINPFTVVRNVILVIMVLIATQSEMFAQQTGSRSATSIKMLDTYINGGNDPDRVRLKELIQEANPAVYFYDNVVKTYGSDPVTLNTDFNGFIRLPQANFQKATIELLIVRIENPSQIISTLNLSTLSAFTKLKYVYVLASFPYTLQQISQVVQGVTPNYIVVFKSDMGS